MLGIYNNLRRNIGAILENILSGFLNHESGDRVVAENGDSYVTEDN
jgi:hypothetical protein